jgi:ABC-type phosphate/phosphonate transport system permease subunit
LIIVATRSINSLIWALLLIAIIGPGVLCGHHRHRHPLHRLSCAKLLYEAIEEIDMQTQVEAIMATGASRWQVMAYGIVPQIMPAFAGIAVFRWDINIRESTVLGLVGAGGIGLQAVGLAQCAGLAAGQPDPDRHPTCRGDQRVGVGEGAGRHHLSQGPGRRVGLPGI